MLSLLVNYLAFNVGNIIISMLHRFLHQHGCAANILLHTDNCSSQNKNQFMMQYLMWQILVALIKKSRCHFFLLAIQSLCLIGASAFLKNPFGEVRLDPLMTSLQLSSVQQQSTIHSWLGPMMVLFVSHFITGVNF